MQPYQNVDFFLCDYSLQVPTLDFFPEFYNRSSRDVNRIVLHLVESFIWFFISSIFVSNSEIEIVGNGEPLSTINLNRFRLHKEVVLKKRVFSLHWLN